MKFITSTSIYIVVNLKSTSLEINGKIDKNEFTKETNGYKETTLNFTGEKDIVIED